MSTTEWDWPNSILVRVVDGDTFLASLSRDLGFHGTATFIQRLRLNRINTPAASTPEGKGATQFLVNLFATSPTFFLRTVKPYKYGDEWMAEVELPGQENSSYNNVSDLMVASGHAVYWDGKGSRPADG